MASIINPTTWIRPTKKHVWYLKEGSVEDKEMLGLKGSNLCEMYRMGLPVPPAFTLTTKMCQEYKKDPTIRKEWMEEVRYAISKLEYKTGKKFAGNYKGGGVSERQPLLLSVRSSATKEMPDINQTILNLGINGEIVQALTAQTNNGRWALQTYIKFLKMFGTEVRNIEAAKFTDIIKALRARQDLSADAMLSMDDLNEIVEKFRLLSNIPDDPWEQLELAIEGSFRAWYSTKASRFRDIHSIPDQGVAITVQSMVHGNLNVQSGTGVAITRNPNTGKKEMFGVYNANAETGDDLLEMKRKALSLDALHRELPDVWNKLMSAVTTIENHYKDAQELEFTVENLNLYVLETNRAKRKPRAAVQIAVDMVQEKILSEREALLRLNPAQMEYFLFPTVIDAFTNWTDPVVKERILGFGAHSTGGAVTGQIAFTPAQAQEIVGRNDPCILVVRNTFPGQEELLKSVSGVVVQTGGRTTHAIDTMRMLGKCAIAGTSTMTLASHHNSMTWALPEGDKTLHVGEVITLDGHNKVIFADKVPTEKVTHDDIFFTVMQWADRHKRIGVLATANTQHEIATANVNGAEGIGLCCADRFFYVPEQVELMRRFILSTDPLEQSKFLVQMIPRLQASFREIFSFIGTCQMSVRLLDATLDSFLPSPMCPTFEKDLREMVAHLDLDVDHCIARVSELFGLNPVLGSHGAKMGIIFPEITEMQIKAIIGAAVELNRRNFIALPQIVLPGLCNELEVERMTSIISTVSDNVCAKAWTDSSFHHKFLHSKVGCLLQTPRACLLAPAFARSQHVNEVMFDTDVLTALVMGMERCDSYNFINAYLGHHLMAHDPFISLDQGGVGAVMLSSIQRLRQMREDTPKIGVCGEHCGDPHSIAFFEHLGVDYISCPPYRVPIAKVAAAQARISADMRGSMDKSVMRMF